MKIEFAPRSHHDTAFLPLLSLSPPSLRLCTRNRAPTLHTGWLKVAKWHFIHAGDSAWLFLRTCVGPHCTLSLHPAWIATRPHCATRFRFDPLTFKSLRRRGRLRGGAARGRTRASPPREREADLKHNATRHKLTDLCARRQVKNF